MVAISALLESVTSSDNISLRSDYSSVIVSYSNGIDSMGALYWALQNFPKEKITLVYCDTGMEYAENTTLFYRTARFLGVRPVMLKHPKGFLGLLLEERFMFPDMKYRWCTSILKTDMTNKWIRAHRHMLGENVLFLSGERRDESPKRAKLEATVYHGTHLKTERVAKFLCHWHRPCLDYEKGQMFEWAGILGLPPHFCYEYVDRCSCMFCVLMKDRHAIENIKRHPKIAQEYIQAELRLQHTWKARKSLAELWDTACAEVEDDLLGIAA